MLDHFFIDDQLLQVVRIQLGEKGIQKSSSFFTVTGDQFGIIRGNDDTGIAAYMLGKFLIGLVVDGKFFAACFPQHTYGFFRLILHYKISFQPKTILTLLHIISILPGKIAFGKTEIMNSIQQIGLAHAVLTTDPHDPFRKGKRRGTVIFELENGYGTDL